MLATGTRSAGMSRALLAGAEQGYCTCTPSPGCSVPLSARRTALGSSLTRKSQGLPGTAAPTAALPGLVIASCPAGSMAGWSVAERMRLRCAASRGEAGARCGDRNGDVRGCAGPDSPGTDCTEGDMAEREGV